MQLSVNGVDTFVATGGREFDPSLPAMVLLHGAGFDHTTWALHSRWFAHHGFSRAGAGPARPRPLRRQAAADHRRHGRLDRRAARCRQAPNGKAGRPFHGLADCAGDRRAAPGQGRQALSLIGTAATMTVGPDLLKAAEANDHAAVDMVSIWGLGFAGRARRQPGAGLWMHSGAQRVLEQCRPGVLFNDLSACNAYQGALAAAATVTVPTTVILGERDMMTPAKAGKALAAAVPNSRTVVLPAPGT